jgi:hypothetical protein
VKNFYRFSFKFVCIRSLRIEEHGSIAGTRIMKPWSFLGIINNPIEDVRRGSVFVNFVLDSVMGHAVLASRKPQGNILRNYSHYTKGKAVNSHC